MGGAVSSGRDNNELVDNLMGGNYIRTHDVERVFRALDRAEYMTPDGKDQAYKDLAWRSGPLHLSAPCIYSEVLEALELKPGLSFLNIGSGTGYFSTLVGLLIESSGINHGVEVHPLVVEYATKKVSQFIENSPTLDEFDFCEPKYYCGNGLCLAPLQTPYDRVYCGAGCPEEYQNYFNQLIKVGGILVMPLNDNLVQVKRTAVDEWSSKSLLNVSFASLKVPTKEEAADVLRLDEQTPSRLQLLCRSVVRAGMRAALLARHPALREPPSRRPQQTNACPRRICIPIEDDSDVEGLNALHDLDTNNGANEMNALLSLVLSMGQNRVAGALRFDSLDSPSDSSDEEGDDNDNDNDNDNDDNDDGPEIPPRPNRSAPRSDEPPEVPPRPEWTLTYNEREERLARSDRSELSDPSERPERSERLERSDRCQRSDHTQRSDRLEHSDNSERLEHSDRSQRSDRSERSDRSDTDTQDDRSRSRSCRGVLTFEFHDEYRNQASGSRSTDDSPGDRRHGKDDNDGKTDSDKKGCTKGVPAEVEIYLGKERAGTSATEAEMVWEEGTETATEAPKTVDSGEENTEASKKDSGIGEGTTTSSGSSPGARDQSRRASSSSDEPRAELAGRRLRNKRAHGGARRSSSSGSGSDGGARKRRAPLWPRRGGPDARRVRLSIMMKRAVKELPLPYALKKFVNWGRCFQF